MQCPKCKNNGSRVVDSRPADDGRSIRRRRECEELWAKNKYYVLSKSHKAYLDIREYLKEKEVDISNYSEEDFEKLSQTIQTGLMKVAITLQGELLG